VRAVELPVVGDLQIVLEPAQQVARRHHAAGEELARHPVRGALVLEQVGVRAVREHVDEQRAAAGTS
jgi:hypothetical protein